MTVARRCLKLRKLLGPHLVKDGAPLPVFLAVAIIGQQTADFFMPLQNDGSRIAAAFSRFQNVISVRHAGSTVFLLEKIPAQAMDVRSMYVPSASPFNNETSLEQA